MKALRTVLLGSAGAALLFVTGTAAQAADAPDAVKGREPVWRCDTAGFIEYPGSDVCFKVGMTVTAYLGGTEDQVDDGGGFSAFDIWEGHAHFDGDGGGADPSDDDRVELGHFDADTFWMGAWARPNIDIRKATEYGIVRLYAEFQIGKDGSMNGRHAFMQIGNWLLGTTSTTFHHGVGRPEQFDEGLGSIGDPNVTRVAQVRYTFDLGNGVQVNVAIQDPARYKSGLIASDWDKASDSRNEGPDFAANVKVSTTWGKIGASVQARQHSFTIVDPTENRRAWGWAALLGAQVNLGPNDTLKAMGGYANGLMSVLENGAAGDLGLGDNGNSTELVSGWSVVGGWTHNWSSTLRSTFAAAHIDNDYGSINPDMCSQGAGDCGWASGLNGAILEATNVWGNLVWTVVDGFDIGVEVMWGQNKRAIFHRWRPMTVQKSDAIAAGITASASY